MLTSSKMPLAVIVKLLQDGQRVVLSRWGDGEWHSVLGRVVGKNCDGHQYFQQMSVDLKNILLRKPNYLLGLQRLAMRNEVLGLPINKFAEENPDIKTLNWIDADVFHDASKHNELDPLVACIQTLPTVLVGPQHLADTQDWLRWETRVDVPKSNAYLHVADICAAMTAALKDKPHIKLVAVSAGMPANILIDRWNEEFPSVSFIDFGSLWDVYVGVKSRKYMQNMDNQFYWRKNSDHPDGC